MKLLCSAVVGLLLIHGCKDSDPEPRRLPDEPESRPATIKPVVREAVTVLGGEFLGADKWCFEGTTTLKRPERTTLADHVPQKISTFSIDRSVTSCNDLKVCVDAGVCAPTHRPCEADVATVPYEVARQFCAWRQMHLPSYAQWQRAIRGKAGWTFPSGDTWDKSHRTDDEDPLRGRRYTSPEGVEYFVGADGGPLSSEFLGDDDCVPEDSPADVTERYPLLMMLEDPVLNRHHFVKPKFRDTPSQFRCVSTITN
jgi:hypothetical protein